MNNVQVVNDLPVIPVLRVARILVTVIGMGLLIEEWWRTVRRGLRQRRRTVRRVPVAR
ncbi:hypothetical protein [Nitrospira calida]|jgi:hypothetical protein